MNDPIQVIRSLSARWTAQYGETLGTEEIRRHLSRILTEVQKREIEQVFANWTGEELTKAIEVSFGLDDGKGIIGKDQPAMKVNSLIATLPPVEDTEYIPLCELHSDVYRSLPDAPVKRRGRPAGAKNKAHR